MIYIEGPLPESASPGTCMYKRRGDVYYTIYVQSTHKRAKESTFPTLLWFYLACAVSMLLLDNLLFGVQQLFRSRICLKTTIGSRCCDCVFIEQYNKYIHLFGKKNLQFHFNSNINTPQTPSPLTLFTLSCLKIDNNKITGNNGFGGCAGLIFFINIIININHFLQYILDSTVLYHIQYVSG